MKKFLGVIVYEHTKVKRPNCCGGGNEGEL